jgi:acyl-CoA synthetase (AMP-forming)/AMP-acid ligase II
VDERILAVRKQLLAPGSPFEIVEEDVLGERLPVFKQRKRSLRELVQESAARGDAEYVVNDSRRITYSEHARLVASIAAGLRERYDIQPGDRVGILAANCPEFILTFWATVSLGGVVASMNGLWTADEIQYATELVEPKLIVGDRKRLARIEGLDLGIRQLEIESEFESLEAHAPGADLPDDPIDEDAPAVILFTSGTTGRPKGAINSHRGILGFVQTTMFAGAERVLAGLQGDPSDAAAPAPSVTLGTPPLFHLSGLYGLTLMMLTTGGKLVLREGRFDPADVLATMERERVTQWTALGSSGPRVATHPGIEDYDLTSVTNVGFGGAPTSPALQKRMMEVFPNASSNVGMGYGSSESVAVVASIGGSVMRDNPESCGWPAPTIEAEIRDEAGNPVPEGVEGEIHTRSAYIMLGYWGNPEASAEAIKPGRWLAMGDIGRIEDGLMYINSRARDMILRSAENVYPVEIEYRLDAHPSVRESAVVGVDHPELGQEVKAIVVPEDASGIDTDALAAFCGETLAAYKVPSVWEVRNEPLPRNAAGKILKTELTGDQ